MYRLPALLLCLLLATACAAPDAGVNRPPSTALEGRWGGAHVDLRLSPTGGSIEYDCANGLLDAAVVPGADGSFRVPGRHARGHGGPARVGERPAWQAAWYLGSVEGDRMQLRVQLDTDTLGPFTLQRGAEGKLLKCL